MALINYNSRRLLKFLLLLISGGISGCGLEVNNKSAKYGPPPVSYSENIKAIMEEKCNSCHSGENPPGNYWTDSYEGLFGKGTDNSPDILPGNRESQIFEIIRPDDNNQGPHSIPSTNYTDIYYWIVIENAKK